MPIPCLETDRLLLREFNESDIGPLAAINADAEVMRHLGDGRTLTRTETWRQVAFLLGHWRLRGYGMWAVERKENGELIGRVGFLDPEGWPGFELGWTLGRPYWGNGYATEAARAALQYAFEVLRQPEVISLIYPANRSSIRVAERLGERLMSTTELFGREVLVYGIEASAYRAGHARGAGADG